MINQIGSTSDLSFKARAGIAKDISLNKVPRTLEEIFAQTDKFVKQDPEYKNIPFRIQLRDILTKETKIGKSPQSYSMLNQVPSPRKSGIPGKKRHITRPLGQGLHDIKIGIVSLAERNETSSPAIQEFILPMKNFNMKKCIKKLAGTLDFLKFDKSA